MIGPGAAEVEAVAATATATETADSFEEITLVLSCDSGWVVWPCAVFAEA